MVATAEDPNDWLGIDAAMRAKQDATSTPGSTWYVDPAEDPQYLAWLKQYDYNKSQTNADSTLRGQQAKSTYTEALAELERQGQTGARAVDTSLLSRGVYQSGEAGRRRDELSQSLALGRGKADTTYANETGGIEADRMRALTQLDLDREQQIVASRARIAAAEQVVPGGGGGGGGAAPTTAGVQTYSPVQTPQTVLPLPSAPGVARQPYQTTSGQTVDSGVRNAQEGRYDPAMNQRNTATSLPKPAAKPKAVRPMRGAY